MLSVVFGDGFDGSLDGEEVTKPVSVDGDYAAADGPPPSMMVVFCGGWIEPVGTAGKWGG